VSSSPYDVPYEVIAWGDGAVRMLDQTLLPAEERYLELRSVEAVDEAIRTMRVRGAPAIGIAGAYGVALAASLAPHADARTAIEDAADRLSASRPTAVNLSWATERVRRAALAATPDATATAALSEALAIHMRQVAADDAMALAGSRLFGPGSHIATHCNTGPLATGGFGTALGVVIRAHALGNVAGVFVDETRPRLQGARLTAWELSRAGVPYHVLADGATASFMARAEVDAAIVGADRIAANGDTANKIGTYALAIAARYHGLPFYVAAPLSTIDAFCATGSHIVIEERHEDEVLQLGGERLAVAGSAARNPAFDVTPADLISGIITEVGVLQPPFADAIAAALERSSIE
jgi:methylthioribose-1-phosphate isomerase